MRTVLPVPRPPESTSPGATSVHEAPGGLTPRVTVGTPLHEAHRGGLLTDRFGRVARDLRVSLTDHCNLRCSYCMPDEHPQWMDRDVVLNDDEVVRLVSLAVGRLGVRAVRFTGGEPLLRRGLVDIIRRVAALRATGRSLDIGLTTNGLGLDKRLDDLLAAGLNRVNISLDSLDPKRYATLTRRDRLDDVLRSIEAARAHAGLRVKINTLALPELVDNNEVIPLVYWTLERGLHLRFIEYMPLGGELQWQRGEIVSAERLLAILRTEFDLESSSPPDDHAPAKRWRVFPRGTGGGTSLGEIGIIASVSRPFCADCDRTRLTADGQIRTCLFPIPATAILRSKRRDKSADAAADKSVFIPSVFVNTQAFLFTH